jgi:membrane protease YdiL (CAAX protease family)
MRHIHSKPWLIGEFFVLMVGIPTLFYFVIPVKYLLPVLWLAALACHFGSRGPLRDLTPDWWGRNAVNWQNLKPILLRFAIAAPLLTLATWLLAPQLLFGFVRTQPIFWLLIMFLYPLLSVVPQEIIFRSFFFTRYRHLFVRPMAIIAASGFAFGYAHILFHNWLAPILCLIGGVIFAQTYATHRSLKLVALEHALYGDFLFTVGLGRYFYHGAVPH